jgi:hypothetical protein
MVTLNAASQEISHDRLDVERTVLQGVCMYHLDLCSPDSETACGSRWGIDFDLGRLENL